MYVCMYSIQIEGLRVNSGISGICSVGNLEINALCESCCSCVLAIPLCACEM
jgi:hypothetical protein